MRRLRPEHKAIARAATLWIISAAAAPALCAGRARADEAAAPQTAYDTAAAVPPVSGEIGFVTDYVYRGVSYSDGKPALQASATWSNAAAALLPGLHVDGWVSSVDFGPGDPATVELWGTLGYAGGKDSLNYDAGLEYTVYPGTPRVLHYNYLDAYAALGTKAGPLSLTATARYAPDYSGATGPTVFADLAGEMPLSGVLNDIFRATAQFGYAGLRPAAGDKYVYWGVGIAAVWAGFTATVKYYSNDWRACTSPCADRIVFGIARSF